MDTHTGQHEHEAEALPCASLHRAARTGERTWRTFTARDADDAIGVVADQAADCGLLLVQPRAEFHTFYMRWTVTARVEVDPYARLIGATVVGGRYVEVTR